MKVQAQQTGLYVLLLAASAVIFLIALGPGFWGNEGAGLLSWQHQVFNLLCHQDPTRSFFIKDVPMAVCSRCIGIYGMFLLGVISMPLIPKILPVRNRRFLQLMIVVIVLNVLDVFGNLLGIWTNTLLSRFLLGSLFGGSIAFYLTNEFFNINKYTEIQDGE
jgi:uncharacterized membrane protein